jgi:hypothetical protein
MKLSRTPPSLMNKKLPQLPFEICEIIFKYANSDNEAKYVHKYSTKLITNYYINKSMFYITTNNCRYGYNSIKSLTLFLYNEIYFNGGAPG